MEGLYLKYEDIIKWMEENPAAVADIRRMIAVDNQVKHRNKLNAAYNNGKEKM